MDRKRRKTAIHSISGNEDNELDGGTTGHALANKNPPTVFRRFDLCLTIARSAGAGTETKQL